LRIAWGGIFVNMFLALFYIVWKKSFRKFMVVRTLEQKIKGREVLPPWPKAKIMVSRFCSDLKITKWGRSGEGRIG
jgi:hypothetical protein